MTEGRKGSVPARSWGADSRPVAEATRGGRGTPHLVCARRSRMRPKQRGASRVAACAPQSCSNLRTCPPPPPLLPYLQCRPPSPRPSSHPPLRFLPRCPFAPSLHFFTPVSTSPLIPLLTLSRPFRALPSLLCLPPLLSTIPLPLSPSATFSPAIFSYLRSIPLLFSSPSSPAQPTTLSRTLHPSRYLPPPSLSVNPLHLPRSTRTHLSLRTFRPFLYFLPSPSLLLSCTVFPSLSPKPPSTPQHPSPSSLTLPPSRLCLPLSLPIVPAFTSLLPARLPPNHPTSIPTTLLPPPLPHPGVAPHARIPPFPSLPASL